MPGIGGDGQNLVLVTVERIDIEPKFLVPEGFVEPLEQGGGLRTQLLRTLRLAKRVEGFGHAEPSAVNVALKLTERLGSLHERAVGIHDGIAGILPTHVFIAGRRARLILLKSVAIAVAVFVDPGEAAFRRRQMLFQQSFVAGRAPRGVQRDQIKRRRVRCSIIRGVRDELEMRKLAAPQFVEDLAWFSITVWIIILGLQRTQNLQRAAGEFRIDQYILQRNDQAIAAEGSDEPRQSRGRQKDRMARAPDRQTQRGHVLQRLAKETVEFLVARLDLDHCLEPFAHRHRIAGLVTFREAVWRRVKALLAVLQHVEQTGVPRLARLKRHFEAEPPIGENSFARCARDGDCYRAVKISVRIGGAQPLPSLRPFRRDLAAAYDVARLDLEYVGKIGSRRDFELKPHRLHAVVGDVEIFVQAASDGSADRQPDRARRDYPVFGENGLVGEENACGMIVEGTAIQQLPRFAVCVDRPVADNPRVEKIEALLARPADLPVRLADEHRLTLVDRDLGRTNVNLECHGASSYARRVYRKAVLSFP